MRLWELRGIDDDGVVERCKKGFGNGRHIDSFDFWEFILFSGVI